MNLVSLNQSWNLMWRWTRLIPILVLLMFPNVIVICCRGHFARSCFCKRWMTMRISSSENYNPRMTQLFIEINVKANFCNWASMNEEPWMSLFAHMLLCPFVLISTYLMFFYDKYTTLELDINFVHRNNMTIFACRLLNVLKAENDRDLYLVFEYMGMYHHIFYVHIRL